MLAAEWADAHPDDKASGACIHGCPTTGLPGRTTAAAAPVAASAIRTGSTTRSSPSRPGTPRRRSGPRSAAPPTPASFLIRDALIVRHGLPRLWARVLSGDLDPARARLIARAITGRPRDVADDIDRRVTPIAHKIGPTTLEKKIDEAMLRLYPEQREAEQLEALDRRFVRLGEASINHTGVADLAIRGDWKDLYDFDRTITRLATALATHDTAHGRPDETLDVRRSRAVGILADPAAALALLAGTAAPAPSKRADLVLHITDTNLVGLDPVARNATRDRAVLDQLVRDWCGRTDTHLTSSRSSTWPATTRPRATRSRPHPGPRRPDRRHLRLPLVHQTRPGLRPRPHRLVQPRRPRRRRHVLRLQHRATVPPPPPAQDHAGWRYTPLETGTWLWADPHGQQFLRDQTGTLDVTPTRNSPGTGCRHRVRRQ